uniref:G-protein coupled receptors family 1 profile domain-containing protein n=1 Tax=Leptobrachium leishanense TaxID=445787 RepID=A0A8C5PHN3_9ANUR
MDSMKNSRGDRLGYMERCTFKFHLALRSDIQVLASSRENPSAIQYSSFVLSIITCVLGLVGNTIVIIITGFVMKTHKSRIWFLNLAIADLLFLLILPLNAVSVLGANWPYGQHVCKMYNFLFIVNMHVSIFLITAMTFERFLSVMAPIWYHKFYSPRVCYCTCAAIWALMVLSSIPAIMYSNVPEYEGQAMCSLYYSDFNEHALRRNKAVRYISKVTRILKTTDSNLIYSYVRRSCKARSLFISSNNYRRVEFQEWKSLQTSTRSYLVPLLVIGYFIPLCVIVCSNVAIACKVRTSGTIRSSKLYGMVTAAVTAFFITRTPLVIGQIIILFSHQTMNLILITKIVMLYPLLSSIANLSCCLNPIIYVFLGREVINVFRNFLQRIRCKNVTSLTSVPVTSK